MAYVLQNLHYFLLLIGPLIFFHELGHFLVAKWAGVRVLRFSLGFGPKLLSFKRGETEYMISAVPLGGYVKMWGDDPSATLAPEEQKGSFLHQPLWRRSAIVAAGPAFNLLLAAVLYTVFFMIGTPDLPTTLGLVMSGEVADKVGLKPGDEIVAVEGKRVTYWSELQKAIQERPGLPTRITTQRGDMTLTPKAVEERDELGQKVVHGKVGISTYYLAPLVDVPDPQSPAARAGVQVGDEVVAVGDKRVASWFELRQAMLEAPADVELRVKRGEQELPIRLTRVAHEGPLADAHLRVDPRGLYSGITSYDVRVAKVAVDSPAAKLGLQVGDRLVAVDGKAITAWRFDLAAFNSVDARKEFAITYARGLEIMTATLKAEPREMIDEDMKQKQKVFVFGAENDPNTMRQVDKLHTYSAAGAIVAGFEKTWEMSALTLRGLGLMFTGKISVQNVGGPVMLFVVAEKSAARGWGMFFSIMALISINLGLMNLLPVPVLDGGHLLFFAAEGISRRPIPMRVREYAQVFGLVLLLLLMALALFNDSRFIIG